MAPAERSMMAWTTGCGAMVSETLSEEVSLFLSYLVKKTKHFTSYFHSHHCILLEHFDYYKHKYTEYNQPFDYSNTPLGQWLCVYFSRGIRAQDRWQQLDYKVHSNKTFQLWQQ